MGKCDHSTTGTIWEIDVDPMTEKIIYVPKLGSVSAFRDIDTHRYTCTKCNEIFYYSSYGRSLYT